MFSLIITIVSIALVAALALATLYYGGGAFNKGSAEAEASKIVLQGQQLLGAADLYYAEHNVWPTMQQLLDGDYLKSVPTAQVPGAVQVVAAATAAWTMPIAGEPVFMLTLAQQQDACAAVNKKGSLRKHGILKKAYTELNAQCYGDAGSYTVIFKKFGGEFSLSDLTDGVVDIPAVQVAAGTAPTADNDPAWSLAPSSPAAGGGTPVVAAPAGFALQTTAIPATLAGTSRVRTATLSNTSGYPVTLGELKASSALLVVSSGTCPSVLQDGQSCAVDISFAPAASGAYSFDIFIGGMYELGQFEFTATVGATSVESTPWFYNGYRTPTYYLTREAACAPYTVGPHPNGGDESFACYNGSYILWSGRDVWRCKLPDGKFGAGYYDPVSACASYAL